MVVPQDDFIKLYINHRPVLPLDKQNIHAAFEKIAARFPSSTYSTCRVIDDCSTSFCQIMSV